jgi:hypothetical protein
MEFVGLTSDGKFSTESEKQARLCRGAGRPTELQLEASAHVRRNIAASSSGEKETIVGRPCGQV